MGPEAAITEGQKFVTVTIPGAEGHKEESQRVELKWYLQRNPFHQKAHDVDGKCNLTASESHGMTADSPRWHASCFISPGS